MDEGDESHHGGLVDTAEPPGGARWWLDVAAGGQLLYQRDRPASHFTLILQGKVLIRTGAEGFELDMGPWSVIGNKALTSSTYVPDFDAAPVPPYRLLRISRASYLAALDALRLQQASQYQAMKAHVRAAGGSLSGANVPAASAPALAQLAAVSTPAASAIPAAGAPSPRALLMPPPPPAGGGSGVTPAALLTAGGGGGAPVVAAAAIRPSASASDIPVTVGGPSSPSHIQLTDVGAGSNRKGFNPKALDSLGALVFSAASAALRRNVSSRSVPDAPSPFANYRATSPELLLASATGSAGGRDDNHTSITIDEVALQRSYSNPNEMVSTSAAEAARAAHAEGAARPMRRSADPLGMDGNDDAPSSAFVIEDEDAPLFTSAPSSLPADRSRWQSSSSN